MTILQSGARDARLLESLAEPLEPERPPFYMRSNEGGHPDGWYWQPAGAERLRWLGRNVFAAERALLEQIHRRP